MRYQETCLAKIRSETEKHAAFRNWEHDDDGDTASLADGLSTRPMSSAGTPQPRISLKLGAGRKSAISRSSRAGTESAMQSDSE